MFLSCPLSLGGLASYFTQTLEVLWHDLPQLLPFFIFQFE